MMDVMRYNSGNMKPVSGRQHGYILLISVLAIGVIASATVSTLLLLGTSANRTAYSVDQSSQSMAIAQGCTEYALYQLRLSPSYAGNQQMNLGSGSCHILPLGGIGNNDRILCVEGNVDGVVRRLQIIVSQVLPETRINSWQEVAVFSLCS